MTHEDHGAPVRHQVAFEPEPGFEIQVVARFVQQQEVRPRKQRGGERHPHPPPARKCVKRTRLRVLVESQAREDCRGPGRGGLRADVGKPNLDFRDPPWILCLFGFGQKRGPFPVGGKHEFAR